MTIKEKIQLSYISEQKLLYLNSIESRIQEEELSIDTKLKKPIRKHTGIMSTVISRCDKSDCRLLKLKQERY